MEEPDRLDDVHMLADDRGDIAGARERPGQLQLRMLGAATYSSPQSWLTMTTRAPSRRARRASARIWAALARLTDHGRGEGMPLMIAV
jgi:hypothetical protein